MASAWAEFKVSSSEAPFENFFNAAGMMAST
jgi:hypothetical protein